MSRVTGKIKVPRLVNLAPFLIVCLHAFSFFFLSFWKFYDALTNQIESLNHFQQLVIFIIETTWEKQLYLILKFESQN